MTTSPDCTHEYSQRKTPPSCTGFETGPGGELVESDCAFRAPTDVPGVEREIRMVVLIEAPTTDPAGNFVDESEANTLAGGRDGGFVLRLGGFHEVFKRLKRTTAAPCCHGLAIDCTMTVSAALTLDAPIARGNVAHGVARAKGTGALKADCNGGTGVTHSVEVVVAGRRRLSPAGVVEDDASATVFDDGKPSRKVPLTFDPNLGGAASKTETRSVEEPPGAGVDNEATALYQGEHNATVWSARGTEVTGSARGRTRLKFLTLYDNPEAKGSLPP